MVTIAQACVVSVVASGILLTAGVEAHINDWVSVDSSDPEVIIEDGFESGDFSRWSAEVGWCDPDGVYTAEPTISYQCAGGLISVATGHFSFSDSGATIDGGTGLPAALLGSPSFCNGGTFSNTGIVEGQCLQTSTLEGAFTGPDTWEGTLSVTFSGMICLDCTNQLFQVTGTR